MSNSHGTSSWLHDCFSTQVLVARRGNGQDDHQQSFPTVLSRSWCSWMRCGRRLDNLMSSTRPGGRENAWQVGLSSPLPGHRWAVHAKSLGCMLPRTKLARTADIFLGCNFKIIFKSLTFILHLHYFSNSFETILKLHSNHLLSSSCHPSKTL